MNEDPVVRAFNGSVGPFALVAFVYGVGIAMLVGLLVYLLRHV